MRLYNKTPQDIWGDIPLSYRIVLIAGALFIAFSVIFLLVMSVSRISTAIAPTKGALQIRNVAEGDSLLDPSIASDGKTVTAIAYTGTRAAAGANAPNLRIDLAVSGFPCKGWRQEQSVFEERGESLLAPDGSSTLAQGSVRYETPSLVYDSQDREAPWKIFAYRYFWMGDASFAQRYSMVVMRTATSVFGPWSKEEWVLSAAPDFPPPPYQGLVRAHINPLHTSLAGITSYARPSVVEDRGVLLMSLVAFKGTADIDRVILMISLDHGKRWIYAGTLLTRAQAAQIGPFTRISGASLLRQGQAIYLATSLGDKAAVGRGTFLLRIADPAKAQLLANDAGIPVVVRHIPLQSQAPTGVGGGYATYDETCPTGIITSEYSGLRNSYQLFATQIAPGGQ